MTVTICSDLIQDDGWEPGVNRDYWIEHLIDGFIGEEQQGPGYTYTKVWMSSDDAVLGQIAGMNRQEESVRSGRKNKHELDVSPEQELKLHIHGAMGEIAVARALGLMDFEPKINTFKGADIRQNIQVRARTRLDYDMIVRPDDLDEHVYVLVCSGNIDPWGPWVIYGWIPGKEAKRPQFAKVYGGRPSAYFIPPEHLYPLSWLRSFLGKPRSWVQEKLKELLDQRGRKSTV